MSRLDLGTSSDFVRGLHDFGTPVSRGLAEEELCWLYRRGTLWLFSYVFYAIFLPLAPSVILLFIIARVA